ncbi:MAG: DUF2029 domain-containing protein [Streptomycetaceae bacterium]|nr:DUF2029 domain-containing protein [Streptomycetaceae bacterium]
MRQDHRDADTTDEARRTANTFDALRREVVTFAPRVAYRPKGERSLGARVWLPLGLVVVAVAAATWVWTVRHHPEWLWRLIDLSVYDDAADSLNRAQHRIYRDRFGAGHLPFIYPPFAALVFYKLPFSFAMLKLVVTGLTLACLLAVVWASWGMLGYRRDWGRLGATLAVAGVVLWLEPIQQTLLFGQVNVILMAAVFLDLALPDTRWWKGVGIGLATGFKLTPGIFVVYLILTRRFRAAAVAVATFAATVLGAWVLIPRASKTYWTDAIGVGNQVGQDFISNQSFNGMLRRVLDEGPAEKPLWLLLCALTAVVGLGAATLLSLRGRELAGVVTCGITGLLVSPISWTHHWVWIAPVFVLIAHVSVTRYRTAKVALVKAAWVALPVVFTLLTFAWPMAMPGRPALTPQGLLWKLPYAERREHHWNLPQFLAGNAYLFAGIALIVIAAYTALRSAPTQGDAAAPGASTDKLGLPEPSRGSTP